MNVFFRYLALRGTRRREAGLTIVEIMIALGLLSVVTLFATVTITNLTATSDRFNQTVQKESSLLNATSLISRDVTLATEFTYAGPNAVALKTMDSGVESFVSHFHWTGTASDVPTGLLSNSSRPGVDISKLPSQDGIVEYRVIGNDRSNPIVRLTLPDYNPPAGGNIFTYFDHTDAQVPFATTLPPQVPTTSLKSLRRVEMHFASRVDGSRTNAMEMRTSAVPRQLMATNPNSPNPGGSSDPFGLAAPGLSGSLTPKTNKADLWWPAVSGADSYEVFHRQGDHLAWERVATVTGTEGIVKYTHEDLAWATDNSYRVIAYNHAGPSDDSNIITMRVTPEPSQFQRIDPQRGLNGEDWSQWTVARGLVNNLYWKNVKPVEMGGTQVSYKLTAVKNNVALPTFAPRTSNTFRHEPMAYGDITRYVVTSTNAILSHKNADGSIGQTGGDANPSPPVTLYSPPNTPVITAKAYNDLVAPHTITTPENHVSLNPSTAGQLRNEKGIKYYSGTSSNGSSATLATPTPITSGTNYMFKDNLSGDTNGGWGSTVHYFARAVNDAGESPLSAGVNALQHPGPFSITDLDNKEGYLNQDFKIATELANAKDTGDTAMLSETPGPGTMTGAFTRSPGARGYSWTRDIVNVPGKTYLRSTVVDRGKATQRTLNLESNSTADLASTASSFSVEGVSPGAVYDVKVYAKSANGLRRAAGEAGASGDKSYLLLTRPSIPQNGYAELMCWADGSMNDAQQIGSYVKANTVPKYGFGDQVNTSVQAFNKAGSRIPALDPKTNTAISGGVTTVSPNTFVAMRLKLFDKSSVEMNNLISSTQINSIRSSLTGLGYTNYALHTSSTGSVSAKFTIQLSQIQTFYNSPCYEIPGYPGPLDGPAAGNTGTNVWHFPGGTKTKYTSGSETSTTVTQRPWVVHTYVCYGYQLNRSYANLWVMPEQEILLPGGRKTTIRAYTDAQRNALGLSSSRFMRASTYFRQFDSSYINGCRWRLDPEGNEPYWETQD